MIVESPSRRVSEIRRFAADLYRFSPQRARLALFLVAVGSLLESIGIILLVPLLGLVLSNGSSHGPLSKLSAEAISLLPFQTSAARLAVILITFLAVIAVRGGVLVWRDAVLTRLQGEFVNSQRLRVLELLARSQWSTISTLKHGRISHTLGSEVHNLRSAAHFLAQGIVGCIVLVFQGILAFAVSPIIAAVIFALFISSAVLTRPLLTRARQLGSGVGDTNLMLSHSTTEFLNSLKVSLSQNLQDGFLASFRSGSQGAVEMEVVFARQRTSSQAVLMGCAAALCSGVLLLSVVVLHTPMTSLAILIVIIARMSGPAMQLQQGAQQIYHSLPAYAHLTALETELHNGARQIDVSAGPIRRLAGPQIIEMRSVTFQHRSAHSGGGGLQGVDLIIPPGTFLGVTGASGAGKTTFADLVVGLFPPQSGAVFVGDEPLEGKLIEAWRESISYVSQEPFLYHTSVRENLLWADRDASEADMWHALRVARADSLLKRLPDGLDAVVGERGSLLSGGERQRIALARALIRKPVLLVLDEATNALDPASESSVLSALCRLVPRPTIVMIAHRDSSFEFCDRVIIFSDGKLLSERNPIRTH